MTGTLRMILIAGVLWLAGFAWFEQQSWQRRRPPAQADGILALTGGADRIETALHLLADGAAPVLMISGVGRVDLAELAARAQVDAAPLAGRVTLGHMATSTLGNAAEVAPWANANHVRSLIVVTAGYHMPRALLELRRTLPEAILHPVPVLPPGLRQRPGLGVLNLLSNEYDKLLAAIVRWPR